MRRQAVMERDCAWKVDAEMVVVDELLVGRSKCTRGHG